MHLARAKAATRLAAGPFFDAMAAYQLNKNVTQQLNVMNLADKVYYNQAYPAHYASIAPGRAAVFNVNLRY